jgi:two-component system sensor histidine kinase TctE
MVVQISRSRRLCEQLLSLAHANESAAPEGAPGVVDLNCVARDVVLQYLSLAHEKKQDLGWVDAREDAKTGDVLPHEDPAVPVLARGAELHEALSNLVHNAIVYTAPGGHITVMVSSRDNVAMAEVRDDGPGIAPARRAEVFERFHSTGPSGSSSRGAGLGMAIARAYARRNGGDIELADPASGAGLRAILQLPLASGTQS